MSKQSCQGTDHSQAPVTPLQLSNFDSDVNQYTLHSINTNMKDDDNTDISTTDKSVAILDKPSDSNSNSYNEHSSSNKSGISNEAGSNLFCLICSRRGRDTILEPCMHFVCCYSCASQTNVKCPTCNLQVTKVTQVKVQSDILFN